MPMPPSCHALPCPAPLSAMPDATAWRSSEPSNNGQLCLFIHSVCASATGFNGLGDTCFSYGGQSVKPKRTTSRYLPCPTLQITTSWIFKL
ncbi:hypothetical protein FVEN_g13181 [Fusarium venenatum]|nr:hypothetical protein FVEN_g13181 [Fusarium venenatum]